MKNNIAQNILKSVMDEDYTAAKYYAQMNEWSVHEEVWYENELLTLNDALQEHFKKNKTSNMSFEELF